MEDLINNFTVKELQKLCRKLDLPTFGLKSQIVERIMNHLVPVESPKTNSFNQIDVPPTKSTRFTFFKSKLKHCHTSMPNLSIFVSEGENVPLFQSIEEDPSIPLQPDIAPSRNIMTLYDSRLKVFKLDHFNCIIA